jgi:hypothetical protein
VIIADPRRAEEISGEMVRVFDEQITLFYSEKTGTRDLSSPGTARAFIGSIP